MVLLGYITELLLTGHFLDNNPQNTPLKKKANHKIYGAKKIQKKSTDITFAYKYGRCPFAIREVANFFMKVLH